MADKTSLVPIEQRSVDFYGDELTAVRANNGRVYASLRHMCRALGVDDQGQRQRINRHNVLKRGLMVCKIHTIQGYRDAYVLRVDLVPLWLTGIRTSMVKDEIRIKLERFQEEAAAVLWEAFQEGRLTIDDDFENLLQTADREVVDAYHMAQAVVKLARQQVVLDARLKQTETQLASHTERLDQIEATLTDDERIITEAQASQLSQAVKAVAMAMPEPNFQMVYGQLYRSYEVTSYKLLPANRFKDAMNFLTEWFVRLTGNEKVPF